MRRRASLDSGLRLAPAPSPAPSPNAAAGASFDPATEADPNGDAALMARTANGDLTALGVLYDRYHDDVRDFVRRAAGGHGDTDDLVQETFLTLVRAAPTYDGRPSAKAFIFGIAAQLLRRRAQRLARWARSLLIYGAGLAPRSPRTPEETASDAEELDKLDEALAQLSHEKRIVVLMVEREGLSGEEVAQALGIPVATVWTRLHYARADLRAVLEKWRRR